MKSKSGEVVKKTPTMGRNLTPWDEMDRAFDTLLHRGWFRPFHEMFPGWLSREEMEFDLRVPEVDILDREDEILVRAELPGVDKKDLEVSLNGRMLTLKGETRQEKEAKEGEYFRSEIRRGTFSRTLQLPDEVDDQQVKAEFKDGVLEVRLPRTHKAERKKIAVE
ncbi:MAG: Hsp20/alpha crystallin family protein [Gammaproteobacteria bacterium]|nr:Hsp20/alpha crystallin family protein [Gammaproteobacteria bacterium]